MDKLPRSSNKYINCDGKLSCVGGDKEIKFNDVDIKLLSAKNDKIFETATPRGTAVLTILEDHENNIELIDKLRQTPQGQLMLQAIQCLTAYEPEQRMSIADAKQCLQTAQNLQQQQTTAVANIQKPQA